MLIILLTLFLYFKLWIIKSAIFSESLIILIYGNISYFCAINWSISFLGIYKPKLKWSDLPKGKLISNFVLLKPNDIK